MSEPRRRPARSPTDGQRIAAAALLALALVVGAAAVWGACDPRPQAALALGGLLLVAAPAVRLNIQGRWIHLFERQIAGIDAEEAALRRREPADETGRARLKHALGALATRREDAKAAHAREAGVKGAWRPWVELCLYAGYACVLAAAVLRVLAEFG